MDARGRASEWPLDQALEAGLGVLVAVYLLVWEKLSFSELHFP